MKIRNKAKYLLLLFVVVASTQITIAQPDSILNQGIELENSISSKNLAKVTELIEAGANVNRVNPGRPDPINLAVDAGDIEIVKYLLSKNPDKNATAIGLAVKKNDAALVRLLIDNEFEIGPALIYAAENNNLSMVNFLIKFGAKVNDRELRRDGVFTGSYNVTAMQFAAKNNNKEMVLLLIKHGVRKKTALDECANYSRIEILEVLLDENDNLDRLLLKAFYHDGTELFTYLRDKGGNVNANDTEGNTLLHLAVKAKNLPNIKLCIEQYSLSINEKNLKGETPLMIASASGKVEIVNYLLENKAPIEETDLAGETALFYSVQSGIPDVFHLLLEHGANAFHRTKDRTTLLMAAVNRMPRVIRYLIENGAPLEERDAGGNTAFQHAISRYENVPEILDLFLKRGAAIDTKETVYGKTLMYYAIERDDLARIKELHALGANIDPRTKKGLRPHSDEAEVIKYVIENGAEINAIDNSNNTYLCVAIAKSYPALAEYLIAKGIDVDLKCYFHEPALIHAITENDLAMVQLLVDNGANVNAEGYQQKSVMDYANKEGNEAIIALLKNKGAISNGDKNEYLRKTIEIEVKLKSALSQKKHEILVGHLKQAKNFPIQNELMKKIAEFGAEEGNPIIIELLLSEFSFNIDAPINESGQTMLIIATINNQTSLVNYLFNKDANHEVKDVYGKQASDYAKGKRMKKIYREFLN